jgi:capsular polysaccharide export protein
LAFGLLHEIAAGGRAKPRIGILSLGLWRQRHDIARLLDAEPMLMGGRLRAVDAIAGWGFKPTAERARQFARRNNLPYIALEDGPLRSVQPGIGASMSYVADDLGIYYDTAQPSRLEALIRSGLRVNGNLMGRARDCATQLRSLRLSKYNDACPPNGRTGQGSIPSGRVLVVDQTMGDASIAGAGASGADFTRMLHSALQRFGRDKVVVRPHPETLTGRKPGHLVGLARELGVRIADEPCNVWDLLDRFEQVFTVSSQLGFEALLAGREVTCFATPFYAGWGLTRDEATPPRGTCTLDELTAATMLIYPRYFDAWDRTPISFEDAVEQLAFLRDRYWENDRPIVTVGLSRWKRNAIAPFLEGRQGRPLHLRRLGQAVDEARRRDGRILVWGRQNADAADAAGIPVIRAEDGFIRSLGLGSAFVPASSFALDGCGIHYDSARTSDFERLAQEGVRDPRLLARAARLREAIVSARLSKYNTGKTVDLPSVRGQRRILVPGQVEGDASLMLGSPHLCHSIELLKCARRRNPDAFILFKPHPDVERGYRRGRIGLREALSYADSVIADAAMPDLLDWCDGVETMTSLTGFEALLRRKAVTVHGMPFYAGWGLTEDLLTCERRTTRLSLDEFVAISLILYPRYLDPLSKRPCPAEILVRRIAAQLAAPPNLIRAVAGKTRHVVARTRRMILSGQIPWSAPWK